MSPTIVKNTYQNNDKTRSVTYRLPVKIVEELEAEAVNNKTSHNVLARQILEKHVQWGRFTDKIGIIPVPKAILSSLGIDMESQDINMMVDLIKPIIKDSVMFIKGTYDLKHCIETLKDYMMASGMKSDHRVEGSLHHFIIQHGLGMHWSLFIEQLFKEIFHEFLPEKDVTTQSTETTVVATISLDAGFNEHGY